MPIWYRINSRETLGAVLSRWVIGGCCGLLIILWSVMAGAAGQPEDMTMPRGATMTMAIDPGSTPGVRVISGGHPFYVQAPSDRQVNIVAATPGDGDLKIQHNGEIITYHITVTSISDPNNPTVPAAAPTAMGATHLTSVKEAPGPSTESSADRSVTPASYQVPETRTGWEPPDSTGSNSAPAAPAGTQVASDDMPGDYAPSSSVIKSQTTVPLQPQPEASGPVPKTYVTNPSATPPDRGLTIPGRNPMPEGALTMMTGTASVYDFPNEVARISTSDSKVADVQVVNPHQFMLVGKEPGFASLFVWDSQNNYIERQVRIEKGGEQQVLLNCTVAEVNRTKMQQQGIDFTAALTKAGLTFASMPGFVAPLYSANSKFLAPQGTFQGFFPPGGNYWPLSLGSPFTYAVGTDQSWITTNEFFEFLEDHALGKVLAQPNLLATSGEESDFISGGEIPIIVSQALNTSIVFKEYGTSVKFLPVVVGRDEIELTVTPEVSAPDYTHQVVLNGFSVPAFVKRRAQTMVRLKDNQTLVIAGLIQDDSHSELKKVPYLGDLPYAGQLFRSTYWSHDKTELVMSVTPRLVRPIPIGATAAVPTTNAGVLTPENTRTEPLRTDDITRPRF
jgi:Flp pilus assembly secretin CpaC